MRLKCLSPPFSHSATTPAPQTMITRLFARLRPLSRASGRVVLGRWYGKSAIDYGQLVLSRDLFQANKQMTSSKKVPYQGPNPQLYGSSCDSQYLENSQRINELFENYKEFPSIIINRASAIQTFIGPEFKLLPIELASVVYGLTNVIVSMEEETPLEKGQSVFPRSTANYHSSTLRAMGKSLFQLHLQLSVVFNHSNKHLTTPSDDLATRLNIIDNQAEIICGFMSRHFMYSSIEPFKSVKYDKDPDIMSSRKKEIHDATCVGGFYTLLGLLSVKFKKQKVIDDILYGKVLNGPNGIIDLAKKRFM